MSPWWSWVLTAIGVTGLYFAGRKVWWAWLIGLGAQVLWLTYAVASEQYGFVVSAFAYGGVYGSNALKWWREHDASTRRAAASAPVHMSDRSDGLD